MIHERSRQLEYNGTPEDRQGEQPQDEADTHLTPVPRWSCRGQRRSLAVLVQSLLRGEEIKAATGSHEPRLPGR